MARNLRSGLRRSLKPTITGGFAANDLFTTASLDLNFAKQKNVGNLVTFTRASSGTYVDSQGVIRTATTNEPRFDHNPTTGESLGLLVEEQRTNLLLRSEEFDNAAWTLGQASVSANVIASPTGSLTADKLIENTNISTHLIQQIIAHTSGVVYTVSCFVKAAERTFFSLAFGSGFTGTQANSFFDLSNVTTPTLGATIVSLGNGWFRCSFTITATASASSAVQLRLATSTSVANYTGDGTSGIYIWGAQLEAGSFPTSYIPTTTAAVTRSADVASITGSNFSSWYRQDEGTVFADYKVASSSGNLIGSSDGTNNNRIFLGIASGPLARLLVTTSGSAVASIGVAYALNSAAKTAGVYSTNYFQSATAGVLGTEDVLGGVPTVDRLSIGTNTTQSDFFANGTIKRLTYWPQRLPNSTLQQITQ